MSRVIQFALRALLRNIQLSGALLTRFMSIADDDSIVGMEFKHGCLTLHAHARDCDMIVEVTMGQLVDMAKDAEGTALEPWLN